MEVLPLMYKPYLFLMPVILCLALIWAIAPMTNDSESTVNNNAPLQSETKQVQASNSVPKSSADVNLSSDKAASDKAA